MWRDPLSTATRGAFTLVEMLVVIAIIGILVALLLPAVQAAREASRRASCSNNLKQLAMAVHHSETAFQKFPVNRYGDYDDWVTYGGPFEDSRSWSWISAILPYIEQQKLYEQAGIPNRPLNQSTGTGSPLRALHCPSDRIAQIRVFHEQSRYMRGIDAGLTNYKGVQGANFCWGHWANPTAGKFDCEPWFHGDGFFYPMDWQHPKDSSDIKDGMSNTFMIGEDTWHDRRASCSDPCYGLGYAWAHAVEANAIGAMPPNAKSPDGIPYADNDWTGHNGFHSKHPGGVMFALGDGSVRLVRENVALGLYRAMCTIGGSEGADIDP